MTNSPALHNRRGPDQGNNRISHQICGHEIVSQELLGHEIPGQKIYGQAAYIAIRPEALTVQARAGWVRTGLE